MQSIDSVDMESRKPLERWGQKRKFIVRLLPCLPNASLSSWEGEMSVGLFQFFFRKWSISPSTMHYCYAIKFNTIKISNYKFHNSIRVLYTAQHEYCNLSIRDWGSIIIRQAQRRNKTSQNKKRKGIMRHCPEYPDNVFGFFFWSTAESSSHDAPAEFLILLWLADLATGTHMMIEARMDQSSAR
jgi:hypothetical protein